MTSRKVQILHAVQKACEEAKRGSSLRDIDSLNSKSLHVLYVPYQAM